VEDSPFTLNYTFTPESSSYLLWADWGSVNDRTVTVTPTRADLGTRDVVVEARQKLSEAVLGRYTTTVRVTCNPAHQCCDGGTSYQHSGEACAFTAGDASSGTCNASGACVRVCTPADHQGCLGDALYWYDSCGVRGDLVSNCSLNGETCTGAACTAVPPTCSGAYTYACRGQEGVRTDTGCGETSVVVTCAADHVCAASGDGVSCRAKGLCDDQPGTFPCGDRCLDLTSDHAHCGACTNACTVQEQCVAGSCEALPGCHVACSQNDDCDAGSVCVRAGDCYESRCEPLNLLAQANLTDALRDGLVTVHYTVAGNTITFTVQNLGPPANVTLDATFGKVIAASAAALTVQGAPFTVLAQDPVLAFPLGRVDDTTTFTVRTRTVLDPSYVAYVNVTLHTTMLAAWNTTDDVTLGLITEQEGNTTRFRLAVQPTKTLTGLTIPVEIPKCLAQYVSELNLSGDYTVIKDDPLIAWHFDQLRQPTEITFTVPKDVDEDCKQQLKAMAYARSVGKPLNPWLSLLLIPVIGSLLIFFQRFTPNKTERLSKREFWAIAKRQGHNEAGIERQWREYKRRF